MGSREEQSVFREQLSSLASKVFSFRDKPVQDTINVFEGAEPGHQAEGVALDIREGYFACALLSATPGSEASGHFQTDSLLS